MLVYAFYESDTRVQQYATALAERGDTVDVLALKRGDSLSVEVLEGVNVFRIQRRKINEKGRLTYLLGILRFFIASALILTKRQLSKPYQIIHVHSVPDFLVFAALIPKLLGARIILDIHDILPEFYASKFRVTRNSCVFKVLVLTEKLSVTFSDHVIIANHLWRERLTSRSVRPERCTAIVNYPDPRKFSQQAKRAADGRFIILYPGTLNRHQGVDIAIRAFARVAKQMPGAEFHIYGEGPEKRSLERLSVELGLSSLVFFHDFLPSAEIAAVMANSDLAVVPKRASSTFGNEAASTKIMEFMSVGVPVIVSRTRIDTFYYDDSTVKFSESENVAEFADAILSLWRTPEVRRHLVENGTRYVERNSWKTRRFEYLSLIDHLSASPTAAHKDEGRCL